VLFKAVVKDISSTSENGFSYIRTNLTVTVFEFHCIYDHLMSNFISIFRHFSKGGPLRKDHFDLKKKGKPKIINPSISVRSATPTGKLCKLNFFNVFVSNTCLVTNLY